MQGQVVLQERPNLNTSPEKRTFLYLLRAWFPVGLAVLMIAVESTEYLGADRTSGPLRWLWEHLFGRVEARAWALIHHIIRKTGHFTGYGIVALTWLRAFWMSLPRLNFFQTALLALLGTALTASADEFHQTFLPNRTGLASDVLLDCSGAICIQFAFFVLLKLTSQTWFDRPV
jgi:VanZ family protein